MKANKWVDLQRDTLVHVQSGRMRPSIGSRLGASHLEPNVAKRSKVIIWWMQTVPKSLAKRVFGTVEASTILGRAGSLSGPQVNLFRNPNWATEAFEDGSWNGGTPKSSVYRWDFLLSTSHFGVPPFMAPPHIFEFSFFFPSRVRSASISLQNSGEGTNSSVPISYQQPGESYDVQETCFSGGIHRWRSNSGAKCRTLITMFCSCLPIVCGFLKYGDPQVTMGLMWKLFYVMIWRIWGTTVT